MNILTFSPFFWDSEYDFTSGSFVSRIHKIYLRGEFDMLFSMVEKNRQTKKMFPFADVCEKHLPNELDAKMIIEEIRQLSTEFDDMCLFTVLCQDDNVIQRVAKQFRHNNICFMFLDEVPKNDTFISIVQEQEVPYNCNFFMEKLTQYSTKHTKATDKKKH
jgi:hypothetical protein